MKNKFLIIAVTVGLTATALLFISQKYPDDLPNNSVKISKSMEKSLTTCKNATLDIDSHTYKLMGGTVKTEDTKGDAGTLTLKYGNRAVRGLFDSGPVNDIVCIYELWPESGDVKTYVTVFLGLTNNAYSNAGTLFLGDNIQISDLKLTGSRAYITYSDRLGTIEKKTIFYDGEMANFFTGNGTLDSLD